MSELNLVLRSRLEAVRRWVAVDTAVLKDARLERGLSYEAVGRLLSCSGKTYERYEKDGRVPVDMIDRVAEVLGLESSGRGSGLADYQCQQMRSRLTLPHNSQLWRNVLMILAVRLRGWLRG